MGHNPLTYSGAQVHEIVCIMGEYHIYDPLHTRELLNVVGEPAQTHVRRDIYMRRSGSNGQESHQVM